ncbi:F-box protein skip19 [Thalictrum thalictroides]|uniref:F-box protein skip19 n=1 Tax=Thalictrum thalictroides TaxID=46969 RepID=A0A7J6W6K2_THATH|nr:F-box protein skip19 [Thalictrum thalictroides]
MTETIATVGQYCPQLKSFRINCRGCIYSDPAEAYNEEALAIAASMPQLRRLHLFGNHMNNTGLQAILDGCPHLEYLDLRQCFTIDLKGDLLKKCSDRITDLRLPNDSTHGYGYDTSIYRS